MDTHLCRCGREMKIILKCHLRGCAEQIAIWCTCGIARVTNGAVEDEEYIPKK